MNKKVILIMSSVFAIVFSTIGSSISFATTNESELKGTVYRFNEDNAYDLSSITDASITNESNTYGKIILSGGTVNTQDEKNSYSYDLKDKNITIKYDYKDQSSSIENDWVVVEDNSKKINGVTREEKIKRGAILVQSSVDGKNWIDEKYKTNIFSKTSNNDEVLYKTNELEHQNGCYYRVMVVYEVRKKDKPKNFIFFKLDKYKNEKVAEVYEFYLNPTNDTASPDLSQLYSLGTKEKVDAEQGYVGNQEIKNNDAHYGWDLGSFYLSGYTTKITEKEEDIIFLKNVGDKVSLWFHLEQDINRLNGNEDLSITQDAAGFSQDFETPRIDLGRGTMIIQYTDYQGIKHEPQIFSNYLEASTKIGANTKVQNFEEGDYEVALLYKITEDKLIDKKTYYKMHFSFSVRNGNGMVFPFSIKSKEEINNNSFSEDGFYLDLAKSKYLQVHVKKEIVNKSDNGLVEDTRFNRPANDGEEYTDEGIYTITATNPYTKQETIKKIYVGTNDLLKAHLKTGKSISEINNLISTGYEVTSDGELTKIENTQEEESKEDIPQPTSPNLFPIVSIGVSVLLVLAIVIYFYKIRKTTTIVEEDCDGGVQE